jgi:type IV secretion system protein VirD4
MAQGGGTDITTMPVLQSLSQARTKWSDSAAGTIWDSSIVKIVLGGASNSRDLQDLSTLIGERDESTDSTTIGDSGSRSSRRSIRRVAIMPPDTIRTLPFGTGLIMLRAAPPVLARLRMWTARPDAKTLLTNRADIEALMRAPAHKPAEPPVSQAE